MEALIYYKRISQHDNSTNAPHISLTFIIYQEPFGHRGSVAINQGLA